MTLADYHTRHIPEYYDTMYLDGFKPWEIMVAVRKKMNREIKEREEAKAKKNPVNYNIHITSAVKVK